MSSKLSDFTKDLKRARHAYSIGTASGTSGFVRAAPQSLALRSEHTARPRHAVCSPSANSAAWRDHGEAIRYVLPDALQAWVIDAYEHEDEVGKAFSQGFLMALNVNGLEGVMSDAPEFARRIKRLADLRERTAACTVDGRMMHTTGLDVQAHAPVAASVYDAPGGLGIVVGETSRKAEKGGGRVQLEPDLGRYGRAGKQTVRVHHEDGSVRDVRAAGALRVSMVLKKWECAAVEIIPAEAGKRSRGK